MEESNKEIGAVSRDKRQNDHCSNQGNQLNKNSIVKQGQHSSQAIYVVFSKE